MKMFRGAKRRGEKSENDNTSRREAPRKNGKSIIEWNVHAGMWGQAGKWTLQQ
jgi:hypothetical protein